MQLSGFIYPKDVIVITNGQTDTVFSGANIFLPINPTLYNLGDIHCSGIYPTPMYFNGNDAISLENAGVVIDVIGRIGEDPGLGWTDDYSAGYTGANGGAFWTYNKTLIRKHNIAQGDINGVDLFNPSFEWDSLPLATWGNLGFHNSVCYSSPPFYDFSNCSVNSIYTITETIVGSTTYDLQTNGSVMDRILMHDDGSISLAWTMSNQYNTSFTDRGTGYAFYDGNSWSTQPSTRLESSRCGWPSMLATGSGKELAIAHNTTNSYFQMTYRDTIGSGAWNEQIVSSQDSLGLYRDLVWNRSAIGGLNAETIHMIGVTAPSGLSGTIYNGLDGALLYYRSQDGGATWDIQDMQLPTIDSSMFNGFAGDSYAIKAQGETVCIAFFGEWDDTFIMKSNDNGTTWTKTIVLDFPVDKYVTDQGIDLDNDGLMDTLYSTDGSGALLLDNNGMAHIFAGNMRILDADLTDASSSYFPATNGLLYWNESIGPDNTGGQISNSVWWSDNMKVIAGAQDMDGDSVLNFVAIATYYSSLSSMPSAGINADGTIFVSFSSVMEGYHNGVQNYRHVNIIKSNDGGNSWSCPVDVTPHNLWMGMQECVFASMNRDVDDKVRLVYQKDMEPGLCVRGDEDLVDMNEIVYIEVDTSLNPALIAGCTDSLATNYNPLANVDDGSCNYDVYGCMDTTANNYNSAATIQETSASDSTDPCTYNCSSFNIPGFYPDSITNLSNGYVGQSYNEVLTIVVDTITTLDALGFMPFSSFPPVNIFNVTLDSIIGLPSGFTYSCLPINCQANGGTDLCITIFSTLNPTINDVGNYPLDIYFTYNVSGIPLINTMSLNTITTGNSIKILNSTYGCTDSTALNYDPGANIDDGSCYYCTINVSIFYNLPSSVQSCDGFIFLSPTSGIAPYTYLWSNGATTNANALLCDSIYSYTVIDANGCVNTDTIVLTTRFGCTDSAAMNYNPTAIVDDGSCIQAIYGCTDSTAFNYNANANIEDGSCLYCDIQINQITTGSNTLGNCDGWAFVNATSSYPLSYSWNSGLFGQYNSGLCVGVYTITITDTNGCTIDSVVTIGTVIYGCTDPTALNYDINATVDDSSCVYCVYGCTDPAATNYNSAATCDDGSCIIPTSCNNPKPTGVYAYDIIDTRAKIHWDNMNSTSCMVWKYFVRYRPVGTAAWTTKSAGVGNGLCNFGLNTQDKLLLNLTPSTTYEVRMKAFYCGGTESNYSAPVQFTTADPCPPMTNLTVQTFNGNHTKAQFSWDTTGVYVFARVTLRVDTLGSAWQTVGGLEPTSQLSR